MELAVKAKKRFRLFGGSQSKVHQSDSSLAGGKTNTSYTVREIRSEDQEMVDFLFTLGCYQGEEVTIISRLADNLVIAIKDARYSINGELAKAILV